MSARTLRWLGLAIAVLALALVWWAWQQGGLALLQLGISC